MPRRASWLILAALLASLLLSACGGGGKVNTSAAKTSTADASTVPSSTTSTTTLDSKILADVQGYYDAFNKALATANPDEPLLAQYMTGAQLSAFRVSVAQLKQSGRVARSSADRAPRVVSAQGTTAIVDVCITNAQGHYFDAKTGQDLGPVPGRTAASDELTMLLEGGNWKVAGTEKKPSACP
jgi:hypothetical protein